MARIPLMQLSDISLGFGGDPLFQGLELNVHPGERLALVGRNGSGKSTLMKIAAGLVEPDTGNCILAPGASVGYMEQDPDLSGYDTLGEFASSGLPDGEEYRVAMVAEGLKFDPLTSTDTASGGERRRAALAKLLAEAPDLMLLDEPTNHLDIQAIAWLEAELKQTRTAFVLISHDRAFLNALVRATLWVDRGVVRKQKQGFDAFEAWRDKVWEEEDEQRHKLNRKIKAEARWAVEGISARRKRNQGRVRALHALKDERDSQIKRQGTAALVLEQGQKSGKLVVHAEDISKTYDNPIVKDFSIKIARGDRIALVGPNGVGKTTLLKMLTGELQPDSGTIKLGSNLQMVQFDQNRDALDGNASLWENLTNDPTLGVSGRSDQVMVRGTPKHVVGYLKDFLFDESQARAPVRSLSGGEKARLLLARILAQESNLLVLDEPTNDLDIETLDLLQELLSDFDGTVILVSHDRDFLDRVATQTIAMEGNGHTQAYPGGWSDYQDQKPKAAAPKTVAKSGAKPAKNANVKDAAPVEKSTGLSFSEQHRLDGLPAKIERLGAEIAKLEELLSDQDLFTSQPVKFAKATDALIERNNALSELEDDWLMLEEKAAG